MVLNCFYQHDVLKFHSFQFSVPTYTPHGYQKRQSKVSFLIRIAVIFSYDYYYNRKLSRPEQLLKPMRPPAPPLYCCCRSFIVKGDCLSSLSSASMLCLLISDRFWRASAALLNWCIFSKFLLPLLELSG